MNKQEIIRARRIIDAVAKLQEQQQKHFSLARCEIISKLNAKLRQLALKRY